MNDNKEIDPIIDRTQGLKKIPNYIIYNSLEEKSFKLKSELEKESSLFAYSNETDKFFNDRRDNRLNNASNMNYYKFDNSDNSNLREIKYNHLILESKLEKIGRKKIQENNSNTENNQIKETHKKYDNLLLKNHINNNNFDEYLHDKSRFFKSNNIKNVSNKYAYNHNRSKEYDKYHHFNQTTNFLNSENKENIKDWRDKKNSFLIDDNNRETYLNKTLGYINNLENLNTNSFNVNNNLLNYKDKRKELQELENEIELSKYRLKECLKNTENYLIDKKLVKNSCYNKIEDKNILLKYRNKIDNNFITSENQEGLININKYINISPKKKLKENKNQKYSNLNKNREKGIRRNFKIDSLYYSSSSNDTSNENLSNISKPHNKINEDLIQDSEIIKNIYKKSQKTVDSKDSNFQTRLTKNDHLLEDYSKDSNLIDQERYGIINSDKKQYINKVTPNNYQVELKDITRNQNKNHIELSIKPNQISKEININISSNVIKNIPNENIENKESNSVLVDTIYNKDVNEYKSIKMKKYPDDISKIDKIYEKGLENYKKFLHINKEINERLILNNNIVSFTKNQSNKIIDIHKNTDSSLYKKSLNSNNTIKHFTDNFYYPDLNRDFTKNVKFRKNDNFQNDNLSPIRKEVKVRYTERELDEILAKNFLETDRNQIDDLESDRKKVVSNRDFTLNPANTNYNHNPIISKREQKEKIQDEQFGKCKDFRQVNFIQNQIDYGKENNDIYMKRENNLNLKYFSNDKTPEKNINSKINYFNDKLNIKDNKQMVLNTEIKMNSNYAYINDLLKKNVINEKTKENEKSTNIFIHEQENDFDKNLTLKKEKTDNYVIPKIYLTEQLLEKEDKIKPKSYINNNLNEFDVNHKTFEKIDSSENLNNKINYIYDMLKSFNLPKNDNKFCNELIMKKEIDENKVNNFTKESNLNNHLDNEKKLENVDAYKNYNLEQIEIFNEINFIDNQRISFAKQKSNKDIDMRIHYIEYDKTEDKNLESSPANLLSPQSKSAIEDILKLSKMNYPIDTNLNKLEKEDLFYNTNSENYHNIFGNLDNFRTTMNDSDLSEIKKSKFNNYLRNEDKKIIKTPLDIIKKKEDKAFELDIKVDKQKKSPISPENNENNSQRSYHTNKINLQENDINKVDNLNENVRNPNGAQENILASEKNKSHNDQIEEEKSNFNSREIKDYNSNMNNDIDPHVCSYQNDICQPENDFSNYNYDQDENEGEEQEYEKDNQQIENSNLVIYEKNNNISQSKITKKVNKCFQESINYSKLDESFLQINNEKLFIDCEGKLTSKLKQKKEDVMNEESSSVRTKSKVKFELKHSYSTKTKIKIPDIVEDQIESEFNLNKRLTNSDFDVENEKIDENIKYELNKITVSDTPYSVRSTDDKVRFSKKLIFIKYNDESTVQDINIFDRLGNVEKHKKFNLLKYLIRLKNNKHKMKKILRNYYNGIREDRLPKKILSSLRKTNTFNEDDKVIGLQKLNEFLFECNKENQHSESEKKKKQNLIAERNIQKIQEIEEARKKRIQPESIRSQTPNKKINSDKNKDSLRKNLLKHVPNSLIKSFKNLKGSILSPMNLNKKLSGKTTEGKRYEISNDNKDSLNKNLFIQQKSREIKNISVDPKEISKKEKEFKDIISNINLQELQNSLENNSRHIFNMSEDVTNLK